jgi:hypothetical protein
MAKLPDNFVKPPAETSRLATSKPAGAAKPAGKEARRKAKRGVLDMQADAAEHAHSVLVRLSPEEHQALSAACEALAAVGETVTVEDMIRQVVTRWMAATRATPTPEVPASSGAADDPILAQLRRLVERPVRRWRELVQALRRWSRVPAGSRGPMRY